MPSAQAAGSGSRHLSHTPMRNRRFVWEKVVTLTFASWNRHSANLRATARLQRLCNGCLPVAEIDVATAGGITTASARGPASIGKPADYDPRSSRA